MQNQPTTQPFTPQTVPPAPQGQPYQAPPVFQAQPVFQAMPVQRSNGDATAALVLGIISFIATLIAMAVIANTSSDSSGFTGTAIMVFLGGSLFALPSIASGKAGLSRGPVDGGELRSSTGLVFGYFFYLSYFAVLLLHLFKAS